LERRKIFVPNFLVLIPTRRIFPFEPRQSCKDMSSSDNHRGDMEAAGTSDSAVLVEQMQAELRNLIVRRECLVRRIQNLRQVMRDLRAISSAPFIYRSAEPASPAIHKRATAPFPANRAAAGVPCRHLQSGMQRKTERVNVQLQRACRIAMLEAEKPLSLEEICTRIVRRGSFSFVNPEHANPVLLQVLNAMAEDGEVRLLGSAPCWRWGRMAPSKEAWHPAPWNTASKTELG
jgi:hypothetical protein